MLNDLWNNLIMMAVRQTDLSQRRNSVTDMSAALLKGEKDCGSEGWGMERWKQGRTDSNFSYVIHLKVLYDKYIKNDSFFFCPAEYFSKYAAAGHFMQQKLWEVFELEVLTCINLANFSTNAVLIIYLPGPA